MVSLCSLLQINRNVRKLFRWASSNQIPLTELLPNHIQCRLLGPLELLYAQLFFFLILVQTANQAIIQSALYRGIGNQMCVFLDVRIVFSDMQEAKQDEPLLWVFPTFPPS